MRPGLGREGPGRDDVLASYLRWELVSPRLQRFLAGRIARGVETYGERLTAHNGRDALRDATEELADALLYLHQARMEGQPADEDPLLREALRLLRQHTGGHLAGTGPARPEPEGPSVAALHGTVPTRYIPQEGRAHAAEGGPVAWMKVLKLAPVLVDIIGDVEAKVKASKAEGSAGGSKLTADEIAKIVLSELGPLVSAIVALF